MALQWLPMSALATGKELLTCYLLSTSSSAEESKHFFFWGGAFVCVKCVSDPQQDIYIYREREVLNREIY